jgi:hypothetical protein
MLAGHHAPYDIPELGLTWWTRWNAPSLTRWCDKSRELDMIMVTG